MTQTGLSVQTLIHASNPTVITATCVAEIIDYTRYMRISHSRRLEGVFAGYKQPPGVINTKQLALSSKVQSKVSQGVPPAVFERYQVSPTFLVGFWVGFVSLLIISVIVLVLMALNCQVSKLNKTSKLRTIFVKVKEGAQNYLLQQFYASYGDIVLFGGLQFNSPKLNAGLSIFSLILTVVFIIIGITVLVKHIALLLKYQKIKKEANKTVNKSKELEDFKASIGGYKTFFEDFKDSNLNYQSFLLYFILRSIIHSLCLVTLYDHPIAQSVIFIITSVLLFAYVIIMRPFEKPLGNIQQICFEILILFVNITLFVMAVTDHQEGDHKDVIENVGEIIIACNVIAKLIPIIFIAVDVIKILWKEYKEMKSKRKVNVENTVQKINEKLGLKEIEIHNSMTKETSSLISGQSLPEILALRQNRVFLKSPFSKLWPRAIINKEISETIILQGITDRTLTRSDLQGDTSLIKNVELKTSDNPSDINKSIKGDEKAPADNEEVKNLKDETEIKATSPIKRRRM